MRVSTIGMAQASLNTMLTQQANLSKTQLQIASGNRMLAPADDPYSAANALNMEERISITEQYEENVILAKNRLNLEEGILANVTLVAQRLNELIVQGKNDSLTKENRQTIAAEVNQMRDQLLSLANTSDSNGEYLFAGYKGSSKPFTPDGAGNFIYGGDSGQRRIRIGPATSLPVGDSGNEVFREIRTGNGTFRASENAANTGTGVIFSNTVVGTYIPDNYNITFTSPAIAGNPPDYTVTDSGGGVVTSGTYANDSAISFNGHQITIKGTPQPGDRFLTEPSPNQDLFKTVQDFADALVVDTSTPTAKAMYHNALTRVSENLNSAMDNIFEIRSKVGARLNSIDKQEMINETFMLQMKTSLSAIKDLDYAEAITTLNLQMTGLQAAQQSYTKIQSLSLFNYL